MLVRFKSAAGDITMFGDVAVTLLKMMGQSGALPGAILPRDIPSALERLKRTVAAAPAAPAADSSEETDETPRVSLGQRAWPLIELLGRCVKQDCHLIWEEERPLFHR